MSFVNRERAARLLAAANLDALVVAEPEGFRTLSGVAQGVAALFRRAGAGFAVLPADPSKPVGIVIGDLFVDAARRIVPDARSHPLWMEHADLAGTDARLPVERRIVEGWRHAGRPAGFARPATFDLRAASRALGDLLADRGLATARLGFDLDYVAANDARVIADTLPRATILDGSPTLDRLRMVKTAGEIERLTLALALSEAGLEALTAGVREGQSAADLHDLFRQGIADEAGRRNVPAPPSWDYVSIGGDPWMTGGRVEEGVIVKADVGCVVDGYSSDTSRNYVFGMPTADQTRLHLMLEAAFAAGLAAIRPGVALKEAHRAATESLHAAGLTGFSRGHFGHGLGHSLFNEQWPFIAADSETLFEPDMVIAFEVPIYVSGLGGFNLEDQLIVEPGGHRAMTRLPRGLTSIG
jgi:Xaa-Pro aminopeptidase